MSSCHTTESHTSSIVSILRRPDNRDDTISSTLSVSIHEDRNTELEIPRMDPSDKRRFWISPRRIRRNMNEQWNKPKSNRRKVAPSGSNGKSPKQQPSSAEPPKQLKAPPPEYLRFARNIKGLFVRSPKATRELLPPPRAQPRRSWQRSANGHEHPLATNVQRQRRKQHHHQPSPPTPQKAKRDANARHRQQSPQTPDRGSRDANEKPDSNYTLEMILASPSSNTTASSSSCSSSKTNSSRRKKDKTKRRKSDPKHSSHSRTSTVASSDDSSEITDRNWFLYSGDGWEDLPPLVRSHARELGYTRTLWNGDRQDLAVFGTRWKNLTVHQQAAARVLGGYEEKTWDEDVKLLGEVKRLVASRKAPETKPSPQDPSKEQPLPPVSTEGKPLSMVKRRRKRREKKKSKATKEDAGHPL